VKTAF